MSVVISTVPLEERMVPKFVFGSFLSSSTPPTTSASTSPWLCSTPLIDPWPRMVCASPVVRDPVAEVVILARVLGALRVIWPLPPTVIAFSQWSVVMEPPPVGLMAMVPSLVPLASREMLSALSM